jgi:hypothetical protein
MSNPLRNTDPNDDPVTYSASQLPEGLSINPQTGVVSGTIDLRRPKKRVRTRRNVLEVSN